jgi:iron complex outermembrane receptor protein
LPVSRVRRSTVRGFPRREDLGRFTTTLVFLGPQPATPMKNHAYRFGRAMLAAALVAPLGAAADAKSEKNFGDLSLEELMNESVTSVAKKETRLGDSPTAIAVITAEEIRRSGLNSLPELLRLVPGLHVARIHGNEWAITARGFNDQYANKLLVLVDGRSIYTPMFAGVYWNAQDLLLEDLDRIEVIRGPGATLWGANAVNGVINVTTRSAKETPGGLFTAAWGTEDRPVIGARYGGQLAPDVHYRVYARYFSREGFVPRANADPADNWDTFRLGARLDWEPAKADRLTLQGDYYRGTVREYFEAVALTPPFVRPEYLAHRNSGGNILGRWRRQLAPVSEFTVQAYYDRFIHGDGDIVESRDTFDVDLQHRLPLGSRHDVVWGAGFRHTQDRLTPTFYLTFTPERAPEQLYSWFAQDEITLVPQRLRLTLGTKVEHYRSSGWEVQPSGRLLWTPTPRQSAWLAVSRAVRTPSRYDRDSRLNAAAFQFPGSPPFLVSLFSRPDAKRETVIAYEAGYRVEPVERLSLDFATFYNVYDQLLNYEVGPVVFESTPPPPHLLLPLNFTNSLSGETYGAETALVWRVTDAWRLTASHTWLRLRMRPDESKEAENPRHQFQLRSYFDLGRRVQVNILGFYVRRITTPLDNLRVPVATYVRLDLGVSWQPNESVELGIWGQNLLDRRHPEYGSFKTQALTEIPRSIRAKIVWRF